MTVAATSLAAYDSVDIATCEAEVLGAIRDIYREGRCPSDQDIADRLGWTINRVTPRRGELAAEGLIQKAGKKIGPTGRKVTTWMPVWQQLTLLKDSP